MRLYEKQITLRKTNLNSLNALPTLKDGVYHVLENHEIPIRFAVVDTTGDELTCEVGILKAEASEVPEHVYHKKHSIFNFERRESENAEKFNVMHLIPTGIGCDAGGHVDGGVTAQLLGSVCDTLITHPNVVNAADINEMPKNTLYLEGSILTKFIMGTIGLQPVRSNRVLVISDKHKENFFNNALVNSVNAAHVCYGLDVPEIVFLDPALAVRATTSDSGRAVGEIHDFKHLLKAAYDRQGLFDAIAITTSIDTLDEVRNAYYTNETKGIKVNPWGGVEAMLTHMLSLHFNVPTAHSPMEASADVLSWDPGIVDPRIAAEAVSVAYVQCILKGLQRSPKIIKKRTQMYLPGVLTARDISVLVVPDNSIGLPVYAALTQNIPVIVVRNDNIMKCDISELPWQKGKIFYADNYFEAAGILTALRHGIHPRSVRRPVGTIPTTNVENV